MDLGLILRSLLLVLLLGTAQASWRESLPDARPVGAGEMRWFGIKLYRAELYNAVGRFDGQQPYALLLRYARSFKAQRIVDASVDQMRKLGAPQERLPGWARLMQQAFVDVQAGDALTGVHIPGKGARFYAGERLTAQIDDPDFARWFFAIWLDPNTSEPDLRRQLLGGGS